MRSDFSLNTVQHQAMCGDLLMVSLNVGWQSILHVEFAPLFHILFKTPEKAPRIKVHPNTPRKCDALDSAGCGHGEVRRVTLLGSPTCRRSPAEGRSVVATIVYSSKTVIIPHAAPAIGNSSAPLT